ncbi:hypothetical protein C8Q77DRAFT_475089 [Trametes polyzona]|nr:hypothetical protein C8Q77DRAFT_475089 [Trametes polyzona]
MNSDDNLVHTIPTDIPPRAPSRAGHRRPPLIRTTASTDLAAQPISTSGPRVVSPPSNMSDSDEDEDLSPKALPTALPPLCPPSPISSASSASGSDLDSPTSSTEDLRELDDDQGPNLDGFPLPPATYSPTPLIIQPAIPVPATPPVQAAFLPPPPPPLTYHGHSRSALATLREFWDRRFRLWHAWRTHVDRLDAIQADLLPDPGEDPDGTLPSLRYPPPPILPRTRTVPGLVANGIIIAPGSPPRSDDDQIGWGRRARLPVYNPYAPIFPRMGDLHALHELWCDWQDRAFVFYPTYAISKTLWLHDVLLANGVYAPLDNCEDHDNCGAVAARPWPVDWRARWQVLIDRQPHPPQPYPPPPMTPDAEASLIHGWTAPQDAPSDLSQVQYDPDDGEVPFAWQPAPDGAPYLYGEGVDGESPLTRVELAVADGAADSDLGVRTHTPEPLQGWRTGEPAPKPVVKLPGTPRAVSLAEELSRVAGEEDAACHVPRPASPTPRFFFIEDDEDVDVRGPDMMEEEDIADAVYGACPGAMVSVSVQPVPC